MRSGTTSFPMPKSSARSHHKPQLPPAGPPTVSPRWLAAAIGLTLVAAVFCGWAALCFVFWQGSWQLLYHPAKAVPRTPASAGLSFDALGFAATEAGNPQLHGWWIPAAPDAANARYTAVYLHGANGNLANTVDALARLHAAGLNILAFDYRGYGESLYVRPSEAHWREDAESALAYLTGTRHIPAASIIFIGEDLGANLALQVAAAHPQLAGVVLCNPLEDPLSAVFNDPRAHLVPAHLLLRDRFDLNGPAASLRIPSLWMDSTQPGIQSPQGQSRQDEPPAYRRVTAPREFVATGTSSGAAQDPCAALTLWLKSLPAETNSQQ